MNRLQFANYGIKNQKIEYHTPNAVFFHSCLAGLEVSVRLWRSVTVQSYCKMLAWYMCVNQIGCDILHVNIKVFKVFFYDRILFCTKSSCDLVQNDAFLLQSNQYMSAIIEHKITCIKIIGSNTYDCRGHYTLNYVEKKN